MSQQSQLLTFSLTCPGPRAWLVLNSDDRKSRVVEMQQRYPGLWSAIADLIPGEYRCRYYCGDDRQVTYYGPAHMAGAVDCGMDALVSVGIPEEKEPCDSSSVESWDGPSNSPWQVPLGPDETGKPHPDALTPPLFGTAHKP